MEISRSTEEEKTDLLERLKAFNRASLGLPLDTRSYVPLDVVAKEDGAVIGGINAYFYFNSVLHITILFVEETYRFQGLGSTLLKQVETEAAALGAKLAHLDTYDFQAKDFYLKNGYTLFAILDDCPSDHKRYYLKKDL